MSLTATIDKYLRRSHINYDVVPHNFTENAYDSACSAHLPASRVIKAVLLRDYSDQYFVLAIIPACNKLNIRWVNKELNRNLMLADEAELAAQFPDCVMGVVPALGQAYHTDIIWDDMLGHPSELYFESGNHRELIHITNKQFMKLFGDLPHSIISLPAENYSLYHSSGFSANELQ